MGLLLLGILDSSLLLFVPLGYDLVLVGLTARDPAHLFYYVVMASLGSVIGCWTTDVVIRKGGEKGLGSPYAREQVKRHGGLALALACVMPPPFPFTAFVIVAAALKFPRSRMFTIIGVCRTVRFLVEALLAARFGAQILRSADTPLVQGAILCIVVISIAGTAYSLYDWNKRDS